MRIIHSGVTDLRDLGLDFGFDSNFNYIFLIFDFVFRISEFSYCKSRAPAITYPDYCFYFPDKLIHTHTGRTVSLLMDQIVKLGFSSVMSERS